MGPRGQKARKGWKGSSIFLGPPCVLQRPLSLMGAALFGGLLHGGGCCSGDFFRTITVLQPLFGAVVDVRGALFWPLDRGSGFLGSGIATRRFGCSSKTLRYLSDRAEMIDDISICTTLIGNANNLLKDPAHCRKAILILINTFKDECED